MSPRSNPPIFTKATVALRLVLGCLGFLAFLPMGGWAASLSLDGVHVVPHLQSPEMQYRKKPDFSLGARVEVYLRNTSTEVVVIPASADIRLRGRTPEELLQTDEWAWHDLPSAWGGEPLRLQPGAMTVWSWNGKRAEWGTNTQTELAVSLPGMGEVGRMQVRIDLIDHIASLNTARGA